MTFHLVEFLLRDFLYIAMISYFHIQVHTEGRDREKTTGKPTVRKKKCRGRGMEERGGRRRLQPMKEMNTTEKNKF